MNQQKRFISTVIIAIVVIFAGAAIYTTLKKKSPENTQAPADTQSGLNGIFELNKKEPGTKLYYSEKLGVGFTYVPTPAYIPNPTSNPAFTITEQGNKIYMHATGQNPETGQSIEVFTKDPKISLEQAITDQFLKGYNPADCFVKTYNYEQRFPNYVSAGIAFSDPNNGWWQNPDKCPKNYSETNGIQYFLMNKDVPDKFLFLKLGQDSRTSDGTPTTTNHGPDWSNSIQILK